MAVLSIPIELDKQRNLRFGFKAMAALESLYPEEGFTQIIDNMQGNPKMNDIRNIFWAGLQWEDSGLTLDRTADILDDCDLTEMLSKLMAAVNAALNVKNSQAGVTKAKKEKVTPA